MEFNNSEHTYKVIPDVLGIKSKYDQYLMELELHESDPDKYKKPEEVKPVICYLKSISALSHGEAVMKESLFLANFTREEAVEKRASNSYKMVSDRVRIENLVCGGETITTMEQLREKGPRVLHDWITAVVNSDDLLYEYEIKN